MYLEKFPLLRVCTGGVHVHEEIDRVQPGSSDVAAPADPPAAEGAIEAERRSHARHDAIIRQSASDPAEEILR